MLATLPFHVIPGHRNAVSPEPKNTESADDAGTAEPHFQQSVFLGSRFRGNDLGGK